MLLPQKSKQILHTLQEQGSIQYPTHDLDHVFTPAHDLTPRPEHTIHGLLLKTHDSKSMDIEAFATEERRLGQKG